jgi:hypothetical protein
MTQEQEEARRLNFAVRLRRAKRKLLHSQRKLQQELEKSDQEVHAAIEARKQKQKP